LTFEAFSIIFLFLEPIWLLTLIKLRNVSMKKNRTKIIVILAAIGLSLYFLYPTYQDYQFTKSLQELGGADSVAYFDDHEDKIRSARLQRMKLGLDLQGGMRVVLEVDILRLLDELAENKDAQFEELLQSARTEVAGTDEAALDVFARKFGEAGIRLSRYYGSIRDTDDQILRNLRRDADGAIDRAIQIVRNRVDQYGVAEPGIQRMGARRIIVELPGVTNEEEVRQLLQGTAMLEFKLLREPEVIFSVIERIDTYLAQELKDPESIDTIDIDTVDVPELDPEITEEDLRRQRPFLYYVRPDETGVSYVADHHRERVNMILQRPEIKALLPTNFQFVFSANKQFTAEGRDYYAVYGVFETPELTGGVITNAQATIDPQYNQPIVTMSMNSEGSREWARITGANIGRQIAIVLDDAVFSAPVVRSRITGGRSQIEGMANIEEARLLEIILKAGALPAPVAIVEQRTVGPSLGEDSIRRGLISIILALGLTLVFMIVYYSTAGSIADLALLFNILFILGVLAGFQATLTLPGIAGIILTIGMAVDANVLIFERVREEQVTGKTLRAAIDSGYSKAFSAIFDANITTFMVGVILYNFGTGPVQGFALTLMIGIVASLFSAIVITRVIFDMLTERKGSKVSFG
jgi:SecD/SecF fusion protein